MTIRYTYIIEGVWIEKYCGIYIGHINKPIHKIKQHIITKSCTTEKEAIQELIRMLLNICI